MEVHVEAMPINPNSNKRKSLFSVSSPIAPCGPVCNVVDSTPSSSISGALHSSSDSAKLSVALTALKVSLKRDLESFAPPTPAVSPAHGRGPVKRTRFDFESTQEIRASAETHPVLAATKAPCKTVNALLAVSSHIKYELEKRRRRERERAQKPRRRTQLSYFAIVGAFQRAAHERDVAMQLECVVEASRE
ncbi:hypothetical protein CCR75_000154 [Bremia lactucae]|uniref:Uncharacterized protein n=1 Tax=Bremia lactucae TaxID=4779 RepID=A0A976FP01_BRELC|nr:hypothetical protein CCR75_000154 [Bremia lactucae]